MRRKQKTQEQEGEEDGPTQVFVVEMFDDESGYGIGQTIKAINFRSVVVFFFAYFSFCSSFCSSSSFGHNHTGIRVSSNSLTVCQFGNRLMFLLVISGDK
jgi:hypothetical protein